MSDDEQRRAPIRNLPARRLIDRARGRLTRGDGPMNRAADRALSRAERLFDRLDVTADTLHKVAELELALLERLAPIVDDLGELVRLNVEEARARRRGRSQPPPQAQRPYRRPVDTDESIDRDGDLDDADVIDVG